MLKSDHTTVGASADLIVWRWRKPGPYELLFLRKGATCFYTKRGNEILCHVVRAPYGALDLATQVVSGDSAAAVIADLSKDGAIEHSMPGDMPHWTDEGVLLDLVTPAAVQAMYAAPAATLETLEF